MQILFCAAAFIVIISFANVGLWYTGYALKENTQIKHVVVIMEENRSFDNYFWSYPGVVGGLGTNSTYCVPVDPNSAKSPCYAPFLETDPSLTNDLPHTQDAAIDAYNNGSMNGFLLDTESYVPPDGNLNATAYYNNETIPYYWNLASHFTLADEFFSSVASYSQPNHWYMLAGTSPAVSVSESGPKQQKQVLYQIPYTIKKSSGYVDWTLYLNQSQTIGTIAQQLYNSGVSWRYYDAPIPSTCPTLLYALASVGKLCNDVFAYDYWNPLEAQNSSYTEYASHFQWRGQILNDIANGALPKVSWVIPAGAFSDHPPANITLGQYWVTDVVNAIENSPFYWKNTVIVVAWDDFGGFFDTIPPPGGIAPGVGFGFRAPAIIISPYSKVGIDNTMYSFESILKFIDYNFGLAPLNQRVAAANDLSSALNFAQPPLAPYIQPLNASQIAAISECFFSNGHGCGTNVNPNNPTSPTLNFIGDDED